MKLSTIGILIMLFASQNLALGQRLFEFQDEDYLKKIQSYPDHEKIKSARVYSCNYQKDFPQCTFLLVSMIFKSEWSHCVLTTSGRDDHVAVNIYHLQGEDWLLMESVYFNSLVSRSTYTYRSDHRLATEYTYYVNSNEIHSKAIYTYEFDGQDSIKRRAYADYDLGIIDTTINKIHRPGLGGNSPLGDYVAYDDHGNVIEIIRSQDEYKEIMEYKYDERGENLVYIAKTDINTQSGYQRIIARSIEYNEEGLILAERIYKDHALYASFTYEYDYFYED